MTRIALLLMTLLFVVGCSTSGVAIPLGTKTYPPTSVDAIVILAESPTSPFVDVALVDGTAATEEYLSHELAHAAALQAMKEKAAQLGAHAIIITDRGYRPYGGDFWEKLQISGKAIRYTEMRE